MQPQDTDSMVASLIAGYFAQKRLAGLGYQTPIEDLDCITGEAYLYIESLIEELKAEELRKASKRR